MDPTLALCFMSYEEKIMPLTCMKCHMSLALGSVHNGANPMSKFHTFVDLLQWGCLRSLYGWHSPSHIEVFHHGKSAPGHLSQWAYSHTAHLVLHCLLKVRQSVARKIYIFVLLSEKAINFCMTSNVRHWVATLCQLMVLLGSKLME